MSRRLALAGAFVVLAGLVAASAWAAVDTRGAPSSTPGVTSNSILLGGTFPLTGEAATAAAIAKGANAYFKYVNSRGGVFGRKIDFKVLDDGYDPGRAVQGTRQLVAQDKVFAIFGSLGTEQNLATRPFLNQLGVPQLFVSSGASTWGRDAKRFPWTIGFIPSYPTEAKLLARYLLTHQKKPKPRIAILYQNDTYGQDIFNGFKHALGAKKSLIVASKGYDPTEPDVRSEVAKLRASKANTFMIFAFGKFAIQAYAFASTLGWHPKTYVNAVASSYTVMQVAASASSSRQVEGSISIAFNKDPARLRPERELEGRLRHVRHVLRVHDGRRAEARRQEPDPPGHHQRRDAPERARQPLPAAGHRRPHDPEGAPADQPGEAAALARRPLGPVREARPLATCPGACPRDTSIQAPSMRRVLVTGMSGTGKSSALAALERRGFRTVDTDVQGWSEWVPAADAPERERLWREDRIAALLESEPGRGLFVSGCVANQGRFYDRFDAVVLLSAPASVILDRLDSRTTNDYGKDAAERAAVLSDLAAVEPLLRATCTHELDASRPLEEVVDELVDIVLA
jgi:branched-chain amino acid transport system substrate-binding protein